MQKHCEYGTGGWYVLFALAFLLIKLHPQLSGYYKDYVYYKQSQVKEIKNLRQMLKAENIK